MHDWSNAVQSVPSDSQNNKAKDMSSNLRGLQTSLHYIHSETQSQKGKRKSTDDIARLVECPPSMHEALGSISSTT